MDIGLSVASGWNGSEPRDLLESIIERARVAEAAGLSALHIGDKHGEPIPYAANLVLAGRLSAEWSGRLGVLVISAVWNPVLLAEQLATLAALTPRLEVVLALGEGRAHFASVGSTLDGRLGRFLDGIKVVRSLLNGETVTTVAGGLDIRNARVPLATQGQISWWIAANSEPAVRRAALIADGWLASAKWTPAESFRLLDIYRSAEGGDSGRAVLRRNVFVGANETEVNEVVEPVLRLGHGRYPPGALMRGTADQVAEQLTAIDSAGFDEVLVRSLVPEQAHALNTIQRLEAVRDLMNQPA